MQPLGQFSCCQPVSTNFIKQIQCGTNNRLPVKFCHQSPFHRLDNLSTDKFYVHFLIVDKLLWSHADESTDE